MAKGVVIGKSYYEVVKQLYEKYNKNKDKYPIKEKSRFEPENYICPLCINPIFSGYIEMRKGSSVYRFHLDCIEDGWIKLLELELNQFNQIS